MIQVDKNNFKKEVTDFKGVVVADFYADWCNPCKILSPLLEEMSREKKYKQIKFIRVNVDQNHELAGMFGVMSIPSVILFKDGRRVTQQIGVSQKSDYENLIEEAIKFDPKAKRKQEIIVFSAPGCPYCQMAKAYLKERDIPFRDVDVSRDRAMAMKMVGRSGQTGVPQLWINGEVIIGFNRPLIDQLLGL